MRLIDADAIIRFIANIQHENEDWLFTYEEIKTIVRNAPTIEAEPLRHGHWIPINAYNKNCIAYCDYMCSECGHEITKRVLCVPNYCENCGLKMNGGAKNENDTADK